MPMTPLYAAHQRLGARFADFAGWDMPISYAGTTAEHKAVRVASGLFDLCHMGRLHVCGKDAARLLETVAPCRVGDLRPGQCRYTMVLAADGGIVDDIIITAPIGMDGAAGDGYDVCVNASNREAVLNHLVAVKESAALASVNVLDRSAELGQIALQGPNAQTLIQPLLNGAFPRFMNTAPGAYRGTPVVVSRTGYTGELGVEIFAPTDVIVTLWDDWVTQVQPCGLGARDTLRLEVGYPLYGGELGREYTPAESSLGWAVNWDATGYLGYDAVQERRGDPRVEAIGLVLTGPGIPRAGCGVQIDGREIGTVTSGNMGLSVGRGVALCRVEPGQVKAGSEVTVEVRGRSLAAVVTPPPFYRDGTARRKVG